MTMEEAREFIIRRDALDKVLDAAFAALEADTASQGAQH
jgi:hypothetical protein